MSGVLLAVVALLLVISALVSAAESAAFNVGLSSVRTLREEGFRGAERLQLVREREGRVRAAALLLNGILNLTAVGLLVSDAGLAWGGVGIGIALPASVFTVLVVGEGIPRFAAARQSIRLALLLSPLLLVLERWVAPLIAPFGRLDSLLHWRNGEAVPSAEEREVRELTELGRREGVVEEEESELVERAFRMDELTAWDIMTPRVDIFAWRDSLTLEEIVSHFHTVPHSRVPVYAESIDDITGILYVREAYEAYVSGRRDLHLSELAREPFFIPGSLPLPRLLKDFQARRIHMGIVADEFGGTDGLVTLEDVLEELVGEIEDETDIAEEPLVRISKNEAVVDAAIELREVNYAFNLSLPHLEHRSLNGFLLEEFGHVPAAGERMELPGLTIEVMEATETQVLRARLRKEHTSPTEPVE